MLDREGDPEDDWKRRGALAHERACGRITIETQGLRHKIDFSVDPIRQEPVVAHRHEAAEIVKSGASIKVEWPHSASSILEDAKGQILQFAHHYTALNPHLGLSIDWFDEPLEFKPTAPNWPKWRPSEPTPAHWYAQDHLERLIAGYITHDKDVGRNRTTREFIAEFRGLKGSHKQKNVLEATGLSRSLLSDLHNGDVLDRVSIAKLLEVMKAETVPVKPKALGIIGKGHLSDYCARLGGEMESFEYRKFLDITPSGAPRVIEAAFCWCPKLSARHLVTGVNWSPALLNPFREIGQHGESLDTILSDQRAGRYEPVIIILHMACARVDYTDRGKSAVVMEGAEKDDAVAGLFKSVTAKWAKQRKAEERKESAAANRRSRLAASPKISLKDAAYSYMEEAYMKASAGGTLPAHARQVMYQARPEIQTQTGKKLNDQYFCQTLLPDYLNEFQPGWDVVFDDRGHFQEPHTDRRFGLGTLSVRDYLRSVGAPFVTEARFKPSTLQTHGPEGRFGAVLFIEKEGFLPLFAKAKLAERFDLAIMSTKGMSNTAARRLVDELCGDKEVPLLVLHDFDKAGFSILGTLQRNTRRYTFAKRHRVIDLGLRLADVDELGLEPERAFDRGDDFAKRINLIKNGASGDEVDFLLFQRVELNALTSDQLVRWIESKLSTNNVQKVIPNQQELEAAYRRAGQEHCVNEGVAALIEQAEQAAQTIETPADLEGRVKALIAERPAMAWDDAVSEIANEASN